MKMQHNYQRIAFAAFIICTVLLICFALPHANAQQSTGAMAGEEEKPEISAAENNEIKVTADTAKEAATEEENAAGTKTQETAFEGYTYSPEGCNFQITLPEEPYDTRRCHPSFPDQCDIMASYTKVFELDSTVTFYLTCGPLGRSSFEQYNNDVIRTMLIARAGNRLESQETAYQELNGVKMGSILGAGDAPNKEDILLYVSQIWVDKESLLTIEGELVGQDHDEADQLFANILRSLKTADPVTKAEDQDTEDKDE